MLAVSADGIGDWAAQTDQRQPKNMIIFGEELMLSWMLFVRLEQRHMSVFSTIEKYYSFLYKQNALTICQGLYNTEKHFGMDKENANILGFPAKWRHGIYDDNTKKSMHRSREKGG